MLFKLFALPFGLLVLLRMGCLLSPAMSRWICRRTARVFSFAFLAEGVKLYWFDGRFCCHRSPTTLTGNLLTEKSLAHIAVRVYNRLHIIDLAAACPLRLFFFFFFCLFFFFFSSPEDKTHNWIPTFSKQVSVLSCPTWMFLNCCTEIEDLKMVC